MYHLKQLSLAGYTDAQYFLGKAFADDERYDLAYKQFLLAAKRNHISACYEVAYLGETGMAGFKKSHHFCIDYYTKSASGGDAKAIFRLAMAELRGELGLKRNIKNGMKWLNRGAALASPSVPQPLYELSLIYEEGIPSVIMKDTAHSKALLLQAAELEYPPAMFRLGCYYEKGSLEWPMDLVVFYKLKIERKPALV